MKKTTVNSRRQNIENNFIHQLFFSTNKSSLQTFFFFFFFKFSCEAFFHPDKHFHAQQHEKALSKHTDETYQLPTNMLQLTTIF